MRSDLFVADVLAEREWSYRPVLTVRRTSEGLSAVLDVQDDDCDEEVPQEVRDALTRWLNQHPNGISLPDHRDTCDRCGIPADKVSVGYESMFGFDGLCDPCLDACHANRRG